ncbi:MAG: hypothetical protein K5764_07780 [Prevotella sp.]|nr:hypothetical protein [Prevotella sp.]
MKRFIPLLLLIVLPAFAAGSELPSWFKKASKSVFTLKTFAADGSLLGSSNGFFVGTDGEAVSPFSPFKGAARAVIIDASDKEYPVTAIMGANDIYDVAKFRVANHKSIPLPVAATAATASQQVWLLPYHATAKNVTAATVEKAETFQQEYAYYTIGTSIAESNMGCPVLTEAGEAIGLLQPASQADTPLSYAISARFADSLRITGLSLNDATLKQTQIRMELPRQRDEATLMLYIAASTVDSASYARLVEEYITTFPNAYDGYVYRAQLSAGAHRFADADKDMRQALDVADKKDDAHFSYARLIYNHCLYQPADSYQPWTLQRALTEAQEAWQVNPMPVYRQLAANILFTDKKYREAYDIYTELAGSSMRTADIFYSAAQCQQQLGDTTATIALLDSAMATFSKPYLKEAAPYLWARANTLMDARQYRAAVSDMNDYEQLMATSVNANFYYIRHQAEIGGRLYQQALNDINKAITMEPKETLYLAEKASLQVRVGQYAEAQATARQLLEVDAGASDGYLFLGLAQCAAGNTKEGIPNLQKAREMGDPQADKLIERYK